VVPLSGLLPTLSIYLALRFLASFAGVLGLVAFLIVLFDMIELLRSTINYDDVGAGTLLGMALLKLPNTVQDALPFVVLVAMMFALYRLARHHELVVIRAAGVSVWQMLAPVLLVVGFLGVINLTLINPFAAGMYQSYESMAGTLIHRKQAALDVGAGGLWLREVRGDEAAVVHARTVIQHGEILDLGDITILEMGGGEKFLRRFEAASGQLAGGAFQLATVWEMKPGEVAVFHEHYALPTRITLGEVQESFAAPETMTFWDLPKFIAFSEAAGFSAIAHRMYWQSLLASPFLLCATVLVAAAFYVTTGTRLGGWTARGVAGLGAGFVLYFFSRLTYALGLSATLPLALAAWAPALVAALLGLTYLFHSEDG